MSDWTEGYIAGIDYTFGYYSELNPVRVAIPFLNVGLVPPPVAVACELGYGQGLSVNAHAAASPVRWYGTDFNPTHAAFAGALAEASGSGAQLFDASFAEFAARTDLPDFDYIGLHGVWSWVSEENQRIIVDFARRKLKVGGVFYLSYNTQPGFAAMLPFRGLLRQHTTEMDSPGRGVAARIDAAFEFADRLMAVNPGFAVANPNVASRLQTIREHNRNYLAHEYFNRDWHVSLFADMAEALGAAKLSFACSAHYHDHIDAVNMTTEQHRLLAEIPDPTFRQSVRDFIVNQQFRRDFWVKGARRLMPFEQTEAIRKLRVIVRTSPHSEIALAVNGALGRRELNPEVYKPVLEALGEHRVTTLGEAEERLSGRIPLASLYEAVTVLAGNGDLSLVQDEEAQQHARPQTERFNRFAAERARNGAELPVLASPVTGGGVTVPRFQQLFVLARSEGRESIADLARFVWDLLSAQGQRVIKDGKPLESPEQNLDELAAQAREFVEKRLPVLQALQIAPEPSPKPRRGAPR